MRNHVPTLRTVCLGLVLLAGMAVAEPVPLPNPGFELVDGDAPAFWDARTPTDGRRRLFRDDTVAWQGQASAAIQNRVNERSRWRVGHLCDLALAPGSSAVLIGRIRTDLTEGTAFLTLYSIGKGGEVVGQPQSTRLSGKQDWTEVCLTTKIPENAASTMVYLELSGAGTAWYDGIALDGTPAEPPRNAVNYRSSLVPEDFALQDGYRVAKRGKERVLELPPDCPEGKAEAVFWGTTARYDMTVRCLDERDGTGELAIQVNGTEVGRFRLDQTPAGHPTDDAQRECVIRGVDVQCRSRIVVHGRADQGERARVLDIAFGPTGTFAGELFPASALRLPDSLRVACSREERQRMRRNHLGPLARMEETVGERRAAKLAGLATPEAWRAYQGEVRAKLTTEILGAYGPKCPLNTRSVGRIVGEGYTIEKVVFESHPNYFVTANLYLPARIEGRVPGVVFTCGHAAAGKASVLYHECCLGMVLKGCVVLAYDPTGQGERSEYVDPETGKDTVGRCCPQHHYAGRPCWLVGRTLAGYRAWDGIRAVDVLLERPEVDPERLAVVGNSGGGQMALLIAAADERIAVCAAAHPGGPMENTYLTGQSLIDRDVLGLIAPRPCIIIVGDQSGETYHYARYQDMRRFYLGLGPFEDRIKHQLVDGVHDLKQPKREAVYAWLHQWFGVGDAEGKEPALRPETGEALHCTETGSVRRSLGGETIASLNAAVATRLHPPQVVPQADHLQEALDELRNRVSARFGLGALQERPAAVPVPAGEFLQDGVQVRKMFLESEEEVTLPAVFLTPQTTRPEVPAVVVVGSGSKPASPSAPWLPMSLARLGLPVLAVDVRAAGECDPRGDEPPVSMRLDPRARFALEGAAVRHAYGNTTLAARQAFDTIRAVDAIHTLLAETPPRQVVVVGEGIGGLWATLAALQDRRIAGVACVGMLGSAADLAGAEHYEASDYFWVPGLLADTDLGELPALCLPRPVVVVDPVDPLLQPLSAEQAAENLAWTRAVYAAAGAEQRLQLHCGLHDPDRVAAAIRTALQR